MPPAPPPVVWAGASCLLVAARGGAFLLPDFAPAPALAGSGSEAVRRPPGLRRPRGPRPRRASAAVAPAPATRWHGSRRRWRTPAGAGWHRLPAGSRCGIGRPPLRRPRLRARPPPVAPLRLQPRRRRAGSRCGCASRSLDPCCRASTCSAARRSALDGVPPIRRPWQRARAPGQRSARNGRPGPVPRDQRGARRTEVRVMAMNASRSAGPDRMAGPPLRAQPLGARGLGRPRDHRRRRAGARAVA